MTKEEILAMKAGRELDVLVGETIFGYKIEERTGFHDDGGDFVEMQSNPYGQGSRDKEYCILTESRPLDEDELAVYKRDMDNPLLKLRFIPEQAEYWVELPRYSTDTTDAWKVVEALRSMEDGEDNQLLCCLEIYSDYDYSWEIRWSYSDLSTYNDGHKRHYSDCFDDFPEAICKAALLIKLKEVTKNEHINGKIHTTEI